MRNSTSGAVLRLLQRLFRDANRAVVLAILGLFCMSSPGCHTPHNLILNGNLSGGSGNTPDNWYIDGWRKTPDFGSGIWIHSRGAPAELELVNIQPNDFYWAQDLHLPPGWYHFTAEIRAEGVPQSGGGANLSVPEDGITSQFVYGSTDWQTVGLYLKVGNGGDVVIACRLGGFSNLNTGKAYCRNFQGVAVSGPPSDHKFTYDLDVARGITASAKTSSDSDFYLFGSLILIAALALFFGRRKLAPIMRIVSRQPMYLVFGCALLFYWLTIFPKTPFDEQVRQAVGFVHGHTYIDAPGSFLEHAQVGAYSYALHPPLPAFLLVPFAAIWGPSTNQTMFAVLIGAINVTLVWILLGRLKLESNPRIWLTIFMGAGTILWYESVVGSTWALPEITGVTFELLALIELFGEARPLRVGFYAAISALGLYQLAFVAPIYAVMLWRRGQNVFWMIPAFVLIGAIYAGLNEARYGNIFDRGLWYIPKVTIGPRFAWHYLPGNLFTLFFMGPIVNGTFPYIHPVFTGQALTLTSPAFVLALRPSFKRFMVSTMGLAALLSSIPMLFYFANGTAQFGTRHYIPAFPFLLVMMALGMPSRTDQLTKILICISIFLVGFGVWHARYWGLS